MGLQLWRWDGWTGRDCFNIVAGAHSCCYPYDRIAPIFLKIKLADDGRPGSCALRRPRSCYSSWLCVCVCVGVSSWNFSFVQPLLTSVVCQCSLRWWTRQMPPPPPLAPDLSRCDGALTRNVTLRTLTSSRRRCLEPSSYRWRHGEQAELRPQKVRCCCCCCRCCCCFGHRAKKQMAVRVDKWHNGDGARFRENRGVPPPPPFLLRGRLAQVLPFAGCSALFCPECCLSALVRDWRLCLASSEECQSRVFLSLPLKTATATTATTWSCPVLLGVSLRLFGGSLFFLSPNHMVGTASSFVPPARPLTRTSSRVVIVPLAALFFAT